MKLSISNIAWDTSEDSFIYKMMKKYGYSGLEIAPTRIFAEKPYEKISEAKEWSIGLANSEGFKISSMQSIWFGRQENLFGSREERQTLLDYTKQAIDFAVAIDCHNLVFGCPKNRNIPEGANVGVGIDFFREIAQYALNKNTVIGMEANPPIYNTNYVNDTVSAIKLIDEISSEGFLLNLDVGTMVCNYESIDILSQNVSKINHVHISEPRLAMIKRREIHNELAKLLRAEKYEGYVSIEIGKRDDIENIEECMYYIEEIFE